MSTADAPLAVAPVVPGAPPHLLVVRAPYYRDIIDGMTRGAERILRESGATYEVLDIAGAFELAQAIRIALRGTTKPSNFVVPRSSTASWRWAASCAVTPTITTISAGKAWRG
jgi:6,7-dimethyl-8-ribityllumazine synthase